MTYAEVAMQLQSKYPQVEQSKMFGMPTLKAKKKAFAGEYQGDMVFKLVDEGAHAEASGLPGAHLFEPMEGRAMKQWVVVPEAVSEHWPQLAEEAFKGLNG